MLGPRVQDRHCYALGIVARQTGTWADAFRPTHPHDPLDARHRFLKLPAAFMPTKGGADQTNSYGNPFWHGVFDASYTQPGDYVKGPSGVFFIASQVPLLPVLCVLTNRTISIMRPGRQTGLSANPYGGYVQGSVTSVMTGWPASVMANTRLGQAEADLPTDQPLAFLNVLLPQVGEVMLTTGDIMTDDLGRESVLVGAELTGLGWRLVAKVVTN